MSNLTPTPPAASVAGAQATRLLCAKRPPPFALQPEASLTPDE